jgi:5-methylcytosine-specific restriction protein A
MTITSAFLYIGKNYKVASGMPLKKHPVASFIRFEACEALQEHLNDDWNSGMLVKGSAGQGQWATVPWIAILYPLVTRSAMNGYYPVYLFNIENQKLFLSMNQGTTCVRAEAGKKTHEVLRNRAARMAMRVIENAEHFTSDSIQLGSKSSLARDYEAGHAFGKTYSLDDLPSEPKMVSDFHAMMRAYIELDEAGGFFTSETIEADASSLTSVIEKNVRARHTRIERNSSATLVAKKGKPAICQACGFDFSVAYGDLGDGFIEAHHLVPLSSIPHGKTLTYTANDFALLCANCHRMVHRLDDPSQVSRIRQIVMEQRRTLK